MAKFLNRSGIRYGRLVAIQTDIKDNSGAIQWICRCDCGNIKTIRGTHLGKSINSCGCLHIDKSTTHGMTKTKEYQAWCSIKARCYNNNNIHYHSYGGRGIIVCDSWINSFETFIKDMGMCPDNKTSIDRYPNNNGNYESSNCRWANDIEQARNTRTNYIIIFNGISMTLQEWANKTGIDRKTISNRIDKFNWTVEDALTIRPIPGGNYK